MENYMMVFSAKEVECLKKVLYKANFHDALIRSVEFVNLDQKSKNLHMILYNKYTKVKIDVLFEEVVIVSPIEYEEDTTLIWFGVEDKDLALTQFLSKHSFKDEDMLYLGFQFLSMNEIKLLCRKIAIAETLLC